MKKFPDETNAGDVLEMRRFAPNEPGDEQPKGKGNIGATPYRWRDPSTIPPRDWLYGRHYVRRYVTATIAPGGLGKSSLALVEAIAMVSGRPLLGQPVRTPFRVWYWNGEDPVDEIERRVAAICLHYGLSESDLGDRLHCDSGRTAPFKLAEMGNNAPVVKYAVVDALAREIRARAIDLMIIDPFVSCHAVSENDNTAIDLLVKKGCGAIADRTSAAIELVHHVRKMSAGSTGEFTADDARGASALVGAARSVRVLNAMSRDDATRFEIAEEQRRTFFRVTYDKSNLQQTAGTTMWGKLVSVPLGNAKGNMPEDLVGVATAWKPPDIADTVQPADLGKVRAVISGGSWALNIQAGDWVGYAIGEALGFDSHSGTGRTRAKNLLAMWIHSGALLVKTEHDPIRGRSRPMVVVGE